MEITPLIDRVKSAVRQLAGRWLSPWLQKRGQRRQADLFALAAERSLDDVYLFDGVTDANGVVVDFRFRYLNPNAERRLGLKREDLIGKILTEERPFMLTSGLIKRYCETVRTGVPFSTEVFLNDERIANTYLNVQVVKVGNGIAITSRDVTEHRRRHDYVSHLAHHDQLTGLANRMLMEERLARAIDSAARAERKVAVLMMDIDHFKKVNDTLGHAGGDALLRVTGSRLLAAVRETDTVARMGGDEFLIIMPDVESVHDVERMGHRILQAMTQPIMIETKLIPVSVSVGGCLFPDCALDSDTLLKNADEALYTVKSAGRNGLHIFSASYPKVIEHGVSATQLS